MLQGSPANYKVLGVGKVVSLQGTQLQIPSDCAPVHVFSIESCATGILVPGQLVLWPIAMLALYTPPGTTQDQNGRNIVSGIPSDSQDDRLFNYGLQVLQLGVMLMQLNDTECEGDGGGSLINWKMLLLYFRCHPRGMKYAYEAMRFITCILKHCTLRRLLIEYCMGNLLIPGGVKEKIMPMISKWSTVSKTTSSQ